MSQHNVTASVRSSYGRRKGLCLLTCFLALLLTSLSELKYSVLSSLRYNSHSTTCCIEGAHVTATGAVLVSGSSTSKVFRFLQSCRLRSIRENTFVPKIKQDSTYFVMPLLSQRVAVFIDRYVEGNCGHILGDEVWPLYRLIRQQGYSLSGSTDIDIYVHRANIVSCDDYYIPLTRHGSAFTYGALGSEHAVRDVAPIYYSSIYFGIQRLSYVDDDHSYLSSPTFTRDMVAFRSLFYDAFGITARVGSKLVLMKKMNGEHLVNIDNLDELSQIARTVFTSLTVQVASWSNYTVHQQVELMAETQVLISLPGSDIMNAIFMPDNSFLIVYCRYFEGVKEGSNEVRLWFKYLRHLHVVELCNESDVRLLPTGNVLVDSSRLLEIGRLWTEAGYGANARFAI